MTAASSTLEAALEELYGTSPTEFTKTRAAIAKRLSAEGETAAASGVRARRKPTQIAWILNQLARRHPDEVAELVDVGRELAREQRKALRGDASTSLRESIERQRKVVGALTRTAEKVMKELGVPPAGHLEQVAAALRSALVDPAVGAQLEEGRLEKAPEPPGWFAGPMLMTVPEPKASKPRASTAKTPSKAVKAAEKKARTEQAEQAAEARAERAARAHAQKKARAAKRAAEAETKRRDAEAGKAREKAERAMKHAEELARAAKDAEARAVEARKALARAAVMT